MTTRNTNERIYLYTRQRAMTGGTTAPTAAVRRCCRKLSGRPVTQYPTITVMTHKNSILLYIIRDTLALIGVS